VLVCCTVILSSATLPLARSYAIPLSLVVIGTAFALFGGVLLTIWQRLRACCCKTKALSQTKSLEGPSAFAEGTEMAPVKSFAGSSSAFTPIPDRSFSMKAMFPAAAPAAGSATFESQTPRKALSISTQNIDSLPVDSSNLSMPTNQEPRPNVDAGPLARTPTSRLPSRAASFTGRPHLLSPQSQLPPFSPSSVPLIVPSSPNMASSTTSTVYAAESTFPVASLHPESPLPFAASMNDTRP